MHAGARAARGAAARPGEPTASTHLRQQQAYLLYFLQRQQRVANRMLEEHVQQHLEKEPGRERQRGPRIRLASLPGQARAPARTQAQTMASASPATRNHSSPWRSLLARLALRRAGSGAQNQAPEAAPPRRRPIRGRGLYLSAPSEGVRRGGTARRAGARVRTSGLFPASAEAWLPGTRGAEGGKTVWKGSFPDNCPIPHVFIL